MNKWNSQSIKIIADRDRLYGEVIQVEQGSCDITRRFENQASGTSSPDRETACKRKIFWLQSLTTFQLPIEKPIKETYIEVCFDSLV